jgi:hypothetical protein
VKFKWKVDPPPVGRYRSFEVRSWPSAYFENGKPAASLYCKDEYVPSRVKTGAHQELTIKVYDHNNVEKPWKIRTLVVRASTLQEAKLIVGLFYENRPEFMPK